MAVMSNELAETCWMGLRMGHPADWELAIYSGPEQPGRCVFADRHFHRLDVRWRALRYVPNLDLILTNHLAKSDKQMPAAPAEGLPPEWLGLVRKTPEGRILHAGRFFRAQRLLIEATVIWPGRRDRGLENAILSSMEVQDPQAPVRQWQAMGLSLSLGSDFQLVESESNVGQLRLGFRTAGREPTTLSVERLAMPDVWLKQPLRDWLAGDGLPQGYRILRQEMAMYNNHRGERLIASARAGTVSALRGRRKVRLDLAWQCPVENRLYRISLMEVTIARETTLPGSLAVRCCQRPPVIGAPRVSG